MENKKVLKVTIDDEIIELFDWLDLNRGMSKVGAIRMGLKYLKAESTARDLLSRPEEKKGKKKWPAKVIEDLKNDLAKGKGFCCGTAHLNQGLETCGCLEYPHTILVGGIMRFNGYDEYFDWSEYEPLPNVYGE